MLWTFSYYNNIDPVGLADALGVALSWLVFFPFHLCCNQFLFCFSKIKRQNLFSICSYLFYPPEENDQVPTTSKSSNYMKILDMHLTRKVKIYGRFFGGNSNNKINN